MTQRAPPSALEGFPIVKQFPIQWGDLDAYGHVNNLAYLRWFESARAEYASRVGVEVLPGQTGVGAVLASMNCKFLRPLCYPGNVFVGVRATRLPLGSVTLEFCIIDAALGTPVAEGTCDAVLHDCQENLPIPVPDHIRTAVEQLEDKSFTT